MCKCHGSDGKDKQKESLGVKLYELFRKRDALQTLVDIGCVHLTPELDAVKADIEKIAVKG